VLKISARIAEQRLASLKLIGLKARKELPRIPHSLVWLPRFDGDLRHTWIREAVGQIFRPPAHKQVSNDKIDHQQVTD
jgi:hypothetical protein